MRHLRMNWVDQSLSVLGFLFLLSLPMFAVEAGQVAYIGGSSAIPGGTIGVFDVGLPSQLLFRYSANGVRGSDVAIPYRAISSFEYRTEVARHLGVVPAIAVGLVRHREVKHVFTIRFADTSNVVQVGIFEVPKGDSEPLLQILRARAPQACHAARQTCAVSQR